MGVRPCDSPFVPLPARESALVRRSGAVFETTIVRLFCELGKSVRLPSLQFVAEQGSGRRGLEGAMVDPKGHHAVSPAEMRTPAWKDIVARTYKRIWDDNVGLVAAGVAFYGFFALL